MSTPKAWRFFRPDFLPKPYELYLTMPPAPLPLNAHPYSQARRLAIASDWYGNKLSVYIYNTLFFFI